MEAVSRAIGYLEARPRLFFCDRCLIEAFGIPHRAVQDAVVSLAARRDYRRAIERCDGCARVTVAVGFVPPVKCGRCNWPIGDNDAFVDEQDDLFHHHCWRILEANARIADSHQIARASRELIRQSLALVQTVSPQRSAGETA